jgi:hypothetical protein
MWWSYDFGVDIIGLVQDMPPPALIFTLGYSMSLPNLKKSAGRGRVQGCDRS